MNDRQAVRRWISRAPAFEERGGAGRSRRARGEDVVDQEQASRRTASRDACERIPHRVQSLLPRPTGLRSGRPRPADEGDRGEVQLACERPREHASLVEAALGPPPGRERHPGHGVGRRRAERRQCRGERVSHPAPSGELQAVDRFASRSSVRERRPRRRDRRRRTVPASIHGRRRGPAAATTPRRLQRDELPGARCAERPRARAASGADTREQDVDRAIEGLRSHRGHASACRRHGSGQRDLDRVGRRPGPRSSGIRCVFNSGYAVTEPDPVSASKLVSSTGTRAPSAASVIVASAPSEWSTIVSVRHSSRSSSTFSPPTSTDFSTRT